MVDEFEVVVDDGSAAEVAKDTLRIRKDILQKGDISEVEKLRERWVARGGSKGKDAVRSLPGVFRKGEDDEGKETDWDSDESDDEDADEDGDVVMDEAPALVRAPKEKPIPEVDEDGFTKVTKKKR